MKRLIGFLAVAALLSAGAQVLRRHQNNSLVAPAEKQSLRDALTDNPADADAQWSREVNDAVNKSEPLSLKKPDTVSGHRTADHSLLDESYVVDNPFTKEGAPRTPYCARYGKGAKSLAFIAARHGGDPETYQLIDSEFSRLRPQVAIVEGIPTSDGASPRQWSVRIDERPGWEEPPRLIKLCVRNGIPFLGGEPDGLQTKAGVESQGFSAMDFQGFELIRRMASNRVPAEPFEAAFRRALQGYEQDLQVHDPAERFSPDSFRRWYRERNGRELDFGALEPWQAKPAAGPDARYAQRIAAAAGAVRDAHLADVIAQALADHDRVLVVYGAGHHIGLRRVLRDLLGDPQTVYAAQ